MNGSVLVETKPVSEAFVEVDVFHVVAVTGHDGLSELRLQFGHGQRALLREE